MWASTRTTSRMSSRRRRVSSRAPTKPIVDFHGRHEPRAIVQVPDVMQGAKPIVGFHSRHEPREVAQVPEVVQGVKPMAGFHVRHEPHEVVQVPEITHCGLPRAPRAA